MQKELNYKAMLAVAIEEAKTGLAEGGIPIGAALFDFDPAQFAGSMMSRRVPRFLFAGHAAIKFRVESSSLRGRRRNCPGTGWVTPALHGLTFPLWQDWTRRL